MGNGKREQVLMTRLRLGHCDLAAGLFLVGKHGNGLWECGSSETVKTCSYGL